MSNPPEFLSPKTLVTKYGKQLNFSTKTNDEITTYHHNHVTDTSSYDNSSMGQMAMWNHLFNSPDSIKVESLKCIHATCYKRGNGESAMGSKALRKRFVIIIGAYLYYYDSILSFMNPKEKCKKQPIFLENYKVTGMALVKYSTGIFSSEQGVESIIAYVPANSMFKTIRIIVPPRYAMQWVEGVTKASNAGSILTTYGRWNAQWKKEADMGPSHITNKDYLTDLKSIITMAQSDKERKRFDSIKFCQRKRDEDKIPDGLSWLDYGDQTTDDKHEDGWKILTRLCRTANFSFANRLNPNVLEGIFRNIVNNINNGDDRIFLPLLDWQTKPACIAIQAMLIGQCLSPIAACGGDKLSLIEIRDQALQCLRKLVTHPCGKGSYYFIQAGGIDAFCNKLFWISVTDESIITACAILEALKNDGSMDVAGTQCILGGMLYSNAQELQEGIMVRPTIIPPETLAASCLRLCVTLAFDAATTKMELGSITLGAFPSTIVSILNVSHLLAYNSFVKAGGFDMLIKVEKSVRMEAARSTEGAIDAGRLFTQGLHRFACTPFPELLQNMVPDSLNFEAQVKNVQFDTHQRVYNKNFASGYNVLSLVTNIVLDTALPKLNSFDPTLHATVTDEDGNMDEEHEAIKNRKNNSVMNKVLNTVTNTYQVELVNK